METELHVSQRRIWPFSSGLPCLIEFNLSLLQIASPVAYLPAASSFPCTACPAFRAGKEESTRCSSHQRRIFSCRKRLQLSGFPLRRTSHLLTHTYPKVTCFPLQICSSKTTVDVGTSSPGSQIRVFHISLPIFFPQDKQGLWDRNVWAVCPIKSIQNPH